MSSPTLIQSEHDEHRNPMSGPAEAVALYDRAIDRMLRYNPEVVDLATTLAEQHADVPMTGALLAYLHLTSTDEPDVAVAAGAARGDGGHPDERAGAGPPRRDRRVGGRRLDRRRPAPWTSCSCGGPRICSRCRSATCSTSSSATPPTCATDPAAPCSPSTPSTRTPPWCAGCRRSASRSRAATAEAEAAGLAAVAVNPDDVWAIHAVVHAHEMRGQVADGIRFLRESEADWGSGNLFTVHNWWHLALFHLEGGDIDDVLRIYDAEVHHAASQGVPLEMVDASALLWRLRLDGVSDGGRFAPLADAWATRTDGRPWYVFNDLHAVMALVGAGRIADAESVVERLAGYVHCGGSGTNVAMTAEIGLPASRAIIRFAQERYADVIDELLPIRRVLQRFGGSHAQRDVLQRTLLEAALQGGQPRPRPVAALGAARGAGDERVRLDPPGAAVRGTRAPGRRGSGGRGGRASRVLARAS